MVNKLTKENIIATITKIEYIQPKDTTLTICILTLQNGFTVTGESACVDICNFNKEIGEEIAYENAFEKIWVLEGYLLCSKIQAHKQTIENIAKLCHAVNMSYCVATGDNTQVTWDSAHDWQKDSAIAGVKYKLDNLDATPADQHQAWSDDKINSGWVYGDVKDVTKKEHPCLVPYEELPVEQRAKDYIFSSIVETMYNLYLK